MDRSTWPKFIYLFIISLFGCSVFFIEIHNDYAQLVPNWFQFSIFVISIVILNFYIIKLPPHNHALCMDSPLYLASLFIFGLEFTLLLLGVSHFILAILQRGFPFWKQITNFSIYSLMITGSYYVYLLLGGEIGYLNVEKIYAYLLTLLAYFLINVVCMVLFIFFASSIRLVDIFKGILKETLANYFIDLATALILVMILESYPIVGLVLFTSLIYVISVVFRKYLYLYEEVSKDKRYREQILNSLPVGIITEDDQTSTYFMNTGAEKILRMKSDELKKQLQSEIDNHSTRALLEVIASKKVINNLKVSYKSEEGNKTLLVSQSELMDQYQQMIGKINYFIDITDTEELEKRIQQSEKLALLGELTAGAAHEIRNPLAVIHGFLTLMRQSLPEEDIKKYHIPLLLKEFERIDLIIEEMLLMAKPGAPKLKDAYMEDIMKEILPFYNQDIEFNINLDRIPLQMDVKQMKQVLYNLIRNSIDSMQDSNGKISIYSKTNHNSYSLFIEDTGSGIPKSMQNNIFNPFVTSKESGTGLGLTIVQRIIENHHGKIELFSSSSQGTTFLITLPLK